MSRNHVIDSGEGKGYVDVGRNGQGFSSPSSPSSTSPRLIENHSTGRGDPLFPDIDMHLGMIFGMNSGNGHKYSSENGLLDERLHMRLKFLEDSNTVMQSRNQNLITENKALSDQLEKEVKSGDELKSQLQEARTELTNEKNKTEKNTCKEFGEKIVSTNGLSPATMEKSAQCWAVCLACQKKLEGQEDTEPTLTITKSELESLESDMQALRDAVVAREETWERAMEREQNYRQQLARLSAESVTARHLSDSRHSELEVLNITLVEKEAELKATQKDLLSLKKIIVKMERRQREIEDNFDLVNAEAGFNAINEKEQKTVDEILRRQIYVKPKQRPRPKGTSSMPQSLQASPRSPRAKDTAAGGGAPNF